MICVCTQKEINMSNKGLLKFVVALGFLTMLVIFLGVNYVPRISALSSAEENILNAAKYAGSDYFERHSPAVTNPRIYTGSDWIERHPPMVSRWEELAPIKDEVFLVDTQLTGPSRLEELARIKER
jgi:hypothetical protein